MKTWMVVEDEPDLYDMVLAMYSALSVNGVSFVTGEEAIEWVEEVDYQQYDNDLPELALIDIRLPGHVNGVEVAAKLRASKALGNVVIVLMTAYRLSEKEYKQIMLQSGADLFLYKPLPPIKEFNNMMQELLLKR